MLDVLVIAPHPDDAELGMAGTIVKLIQEGSRVGILDLTTGEPTPHGDESTRRAETEAASAILAVTWRENLGLTNRRLQANLDERHAVANVIRRVRPKWLFAPYWTDAHPDHVAATRLIEDARFWAKLTKSDLEGEPFHPQRVFHYFSVHLKLAIEPQFVVDISAEWPAKRDAMACYESQFVTGRPTEPPTFLDQLETHAAYWGHAIGVKYGEPFAMREPLGMNSLKSLV